MKALTHTSQLQAVSPSTIFPVPGCQFQPTGLTLDENLKFEEWERIGKILLAIEGSVQWWLGDWLNYGERKYGETYAQAVEATGYKVETLWNAAYVASQFENSSREEDLTWSHHKAVVGLPDDDRVELLRSAAAEKWNSKETERRARARKTYKEIQKKPELIWTDNQEMAEDWLVIRDAVRRFAEKYKQVALCTDDYVDDVESLLKEKAKRDFKDAVMYYIREGCETEESLAQATGKPRDVVRLALGELIDSGKLRTVKQGGKTDVGRGAVNTLYYLINYPPDGEGDVVDEGED